MRKLIYKAAAASAIVAGVLGAGAAAASASTADAPATVTAVTHLNNHPDTTGVTGSATQASPGGSVWARDNITEKYTVTPEGGNAYLVTVGIGGSFHGFADPRTTAEGSTDPGGPLVSDGSVKGDISYDVTSTSAPDKSALPGQSASDTTLSQEIGTLFGGHNTTPVPHGAYNFTYHKVAGADYTQVG